MKDIGPIVPQKIKGTIRIQEKEDSDYSGVLVFITNSGFSAISDENGVFELKDVPEGVYEINIRFDGYNEEVVEAVRLVAEDNFSHPENTIPQISISKKMDSITGCVHLEGLTDFSGVTVKVLGTSCEAKTDASGRYNISIPAGVYSAGVAYEKEGFASELYSNVITINEESCIALPTVELKMIALPVLRGMVVIDNVDDASGIDVSLSGPSEYHAKTDSDGYWEIKNVSLGEYSIVIEAENIPNLKSSITISVSEMKDLGVWRLIPTGASISGYVRTDSGDDRNEITIVVSDRTGEIRTYKTGIDGYYTFSNLDPEETFTLRFSAKGWNSESITVNNLENYEKRIMAELVLEDTIPPTAELIINNNSNTTQDRTVLLECTASDEGSGLEKIKLSFSSDFKNLIYEGPINSNFSIELPEGPGIKTVFAKVYDKSGNHVLVSKSIKLTPEKYEIGGILKGDKLHWTQENSPYYVTDNIMVEQSDTFVIDAGVDIIVGGNYSFTIDGTLLVNGTEQYPVNFTTSSESITWGGMHFAKNTKISGDFPNIEYVEGSKISHANLLRLNNGISTTNTNLVWIENCTIESSGRALGWGGSTSYNSYNGLVCVLKDCEVKGSVYAAKSYLINNRIVTTGDVTLDIPTNDFYDRSLCKTFSNEVEAKSISIYAEMTNDKISASTVYLKSVHLSNVSIRNSKIYGYDYGNSTYYNFTPSSIIYSSFENCTFSEFRVTCVTMTNFINCGQIIVDVKKSDSSKKYKGDFDYRCNYWGASNTDELKTGTLNVSFIKDYYDDYGLAKVILDDWSKSPFPTSGYRGEEYCSVFSCEYVDDGPNLRINEEYEISVVSPITLQILDIDNDAIEMYRTSMNINDFYSESEVLEWQRGVISGNVSVPINFEVSELEVFSCFVQIRYSDGKTSNIIKYETPAHVQGPAGGYVFYDKGVVSDGWRMIEAAPADLRMSEGVPTVDFSSSSYENASKKKFIFGYKKDEEGKILDIAETVDDIGGGKNNTKRIVDSLGNAAWASQYTYDDYKEENYAARVCSILTYNGYSDWYLPSYLELKEMESKLSNFGIGNLDTSGETYNSSSEDRGYYIAVYSFDGKGSGYGGGSLFAERLVRPLRQF